MALFYPDILEHNNPNNPLMDDGQLWGSMQIVADLTARNNLPIAKRKIGMIVVWYVNTLPLLQKYIGPDVTDPEWTNTVNWVDLSYPDFNYDLTQQLTANTTTSFLVGNKNDYATFILDYEMVRGSIVAVGTIQIMQDGSTLESPTYFTIRELGGTLGLVDITTAFNVNDVEVTVEIDGSSADDVVMNYNLIRKPFATPVASWRLVDSSSFTSFNNIVFPGASSVVIGSVESVEYSADNGETYTNEALPSAVGYGIYQMTFIDVNNGFICGNNFGSTGQIWGTTDGGASWSLISTLATLRTWGLWMFDASNGVAYGGRAGQQVIAVTADGGLTFTNVFVVGASISVGSFQFVDALNGFLYQYLTTNLYVTTDGGTNWALKTSPIAINSYFVLSANDIWVVGGLGIRYSNDGGDTWFNWNPVPSVGSIDSVYAFSTTHVRIGFGGNFVAETIDGGANWSNVMIGSGTAPTIINFRNTLMGVAHGGANIYKYSA